MISIPDELGELLQQAYQVDANSTSLLRRLAAAVEDYFDAEDEEPEAAVQSEEPSKDEPTEQYEDGRRHGLEAALSLIQMAESEIHEGTEGDETDSERGAKIALDCIARQIELAILGDSLDTELEYLGLKATLTKAAGKKSSLEPVAKAPKTQPEAQKPAAKPPKSPTPMDSGGRHQRAIQAFLRSRPEGTATRRAVRKHLIETGATSPSGAYRPIETVLVSGHVEDRGDGLLGLPQA